MNESEKSDIWRYVKLLEADTLKVAFFTKPINDIIADENYKLDDKSYLKCLQELSRIPSAHEQVKNFIDNAKGIFHLLCIQTPTQWYLLQGDEIQFLVEQFHQEIESMYSFAQTQCIGNHKIHNTVYDSFLAMIDSLSVYPQEDFSTNWKKILRHYDPYQVHIYNDSPIKKEHENLATLLECYRHIKIFENHKGLPIS